MACASAVTDRRTGTPSAWTSLPAIRPYRFDFALVGRRHRERHLAAGHCGLLPDLDMVTARRGDACRFDSGYTGAEDQHAARMTGTGGGKELWLRMLERFEFRAYHRVMHAGDVLLER